MIRLKCFFNYHFDIFSLTHNEEVVWPDATHPMLFAESSVSACQNFRPVGPSFFLAKEAFLAFF